MPIRAWRPLLLLDRFSSLNEWFVCAGNSERSVGDSWPGGARRVCTVCRDIGVDVWLPLMDASG